MVRVLAMDATTAAVPANAGTIFPAALRLAAAAVALALLAIPLRPLAARKPKFPNRRSARVLITWMARKRTA